MSNGVKTQTNGNTQVMIVGAIVAIVFIGAATMVALALGRPDQVGIIVPLLLGLLGPVVLGFLALLNASKSAVVAQKAVDIAEQGVIKTEIVAGRIDGQLDELKELIRKAAFAEGKAEGKSEQKIEGGTAAVAPAAGLPPVQTENVTIDAVNVNVAPKPEKGTAP